MLLLKGYLAYFSNSYILMKSIDKIPYIFAKAHINATLLYFIAHHKKNYFAFYFTIIKGKPLHSLADQLLLLV